MLRSVQGDLGMRWSASTTLAADQKWLENQVGGEANGDRLGEACKRRNQRPKFIADDPGEKAVDAALAVSCITHALRRHCGSLAVRSRGSKVSSRIEGGPDLRNASLVIGTGGALIHELGGVNVLETALARREERVLSPLTPAVVVDHSYVLAAAGLLAQEEPISALSLMMSEIPGVRRAA
jgi:uncharacterized protein (TIGR01319 family)